MLAMHLDVAKSNVEIITQGFIVITGNKHHPLTMPRPLQNFLHEGILIGRPHHAPPHRPKIDNIADQKYVFSRITAQELKQSPSLTSARTEVDIRKKNRTNGGHEHMLRKNRYRSMSFR